jgi:predicted outer membrane repeat protein
MRFAPPPQPRTLHAMREYARTAERTTHVTRPVSVKRLISFATAVAVAGSLLAAPGVSAKTARCQVLNPRLDATYSTLAVAVAAASPGDALRVKGTCVGSTTIDKDLTVTGKSNPGLGAATLDGEHAGRVLTIVGGVTVMLDGLLITNGVAERGGGIATVVARDRPGLNSVTLIDSIVAHNSADDGGGIANDLGVFTIIDSTISDNTATFSGGGIENSFDEGYLTITGTSAVSRNVAGGDGGGILANTHGGAALSGSVSIDHNTAGGDGGGIRVSDSALMIEGNASIHDNTAVGGGGGAFVAGTPGSILLGGASSISANHAANGGGVMAIMSIVALAGTSSISGNTATQAGGGVYAFLATSLWLADASSVSANTAGTQGGGVYNLASSVSLNDASSISWNVATDVGGGIYSLNGTLNNCVAGANVHDDQPDDITIGA